MKHFFYTSQIKLILLITILLISQLSYSQSGAAINTSGAGADASALLDISSTGYPYQGILIPRLTTEQRDSISSPAEGLLIYNINCKNFNFFDGNQWNSVNEVTASVNITATPSGSICSGTNVNFTANAVNGGSNPSYQWIKNNTPINGANNSTYSDSNFSDGDIISCELISNSPCINTQQIISNEITISVSPQLTVDINISASPSGAICPGTSVTFSANITNGGTLPIYDWKINGVSVGNGPTYSSSSLNNNDEITCTLTSNDLCATNNPAISNSIMQVVNIAAPSSLTLTHSSNNKNFSISYTGGVCWGNVNVQYQNNAGTWVNLANLDGNTTQNNYPLNLPTDNWYGANWNSVPLRLQNVNTPAQINNFSSNLTCTATSGSSSSTPNIDEDCNNYWDNTTQGTGQVAGCASGYTCYTEQYFSVPSCGGGLFATYYRCCTSPTTSPCYQNGCYANGGGSIKQQTATGCTHTGTVTTYW